MRKKVQEAKIGISLYEMNKQLMAKEPLLDDNKAKDKIAELADVMEESRARAWMLLCFEKRDFTIFYRSFHTTSKVQLNTDLKETLFNRGKIISIDKQENEAYEIWIKDEKDECFCYMLFDYSDAIIDY